MDRAEVEVVERREHGDAAETLGESVVARGARIEDIYGRLVVAGKQHAAARPQRAELRAGELDCAQFFPVDVAAAEGARPGAGAQVGAAVEAEAEIRGVGEGDEVGAVDPARGAVPVCKERLPPLEVAPDQGREADGAVTEVVAEVKAATQVPQAAQEWAGSADGASDVAETAGEGEDGAKRGRAC